jgi:hypothetical protein
VSRCDVKPKLLDQARESGSLSFRQVEHEPCQSGRVDDRMLERTLQAATDQPGVEGIVAVLDEDGTLREAKEPPSRILELRGADEHRAVDVVTLPRVRVDGGAAVDKRVEERQGLLQGEALGADLEDEKRSVARRLHVEGDELRVAEPRLARHLRGVDGDLLPRHELGRPARLEVETLGAHDRAVARARRAHAISSPVSARRIKTATP